MQFKKSSNKNLFLIPKSKAIKFNLYFFEKISQGKHNAYDQRLILEFINELDETEIINSNNLKLLKRFCFP